MGLPPGDRLLGVEVGVFLNAPGSTNHIPLANLPVGVGSKYASNGTWLDAPVLS